MPIPVFQRSTNDEVARTAAAWIAGFLRATVAHAQRATFAVSGGRTPGLMLAALSHEDVPWEHVHILQVDERLAPENHPDRNLSGLTQNLLAHTNVPPANVHPMRVTSDMTPNGLAQDYARVLDRIAPNGIDLIQLGLGDDGHTASLVPNDRSLSIHDQRVTFTDEYSGYLRLTLTYSEIARGSALMWLATGETKAQRIAQLVAGDVSIPAGRIRHSSQTIFCDDAAGASIGSAAPIVRC
jgi:6-phosphogluconolactonase